MKTLFGACILTVGLMAHVWAAGDVTLTLENHVFTPKELRIPANKKVQVTVVNKDPTPAEFESKSLAREKLIPGKSSAVIRLGPLAPGRYGFVDEYHENEPGAQGTIIVE